jgi:branched-chain amino acid transport system substrate-binding protein
MKRLITAGALIAAGALMLTGCSSGGFSDTSGSGGDSTAASTEPVQVVMIGGMTGAAAAIGESTKGTLEGIIEEINGAGGIEGRQVELTVIDSESDPTKGVSKFQELISSGDVPDLAYPVTSPDALALLPLLTRENILSMSGAANPALNDPKTYPYHFSPQPSIKDMLIAVREKMLDEGVTSFVALEPTDALGQGAIDSMPAVFDGSGISYEIVNFNTQDIDLTVPYQTALAAGKDAILLDGSGAAAGRLVTARSNLGATNVPTFATNSLTTVPLTTMVDPSMTQGIQTAVPFTYVYRPVDERSDNLEAFIERIDPGSTQTITNGVIVYDALRLYAAAVKQAGSFETQAVADALLNPTDEVPEGYFMNLPEYKYTSDSHRPTIDVKDWRWITPDVVEDGMWVNEVK